MSLYKKRKPFFTRDIHLILLITSIFLIALSFAGLFRSVPVFDWFNGNIGSGVTNFKIGATFFFSRFDQNEKLSRENLDLRKENLDDKILLTQLDQITKENTSLKKINSILDIKQNKILANKISFISYEKLPDTIAINKGKVDGVTVDKLVVNDTGSFIGKVESVSSYTSIIRTYYRFDNPKLTVRGTNTPNAIIDSAVDGQVKVFETGQNSTAKVGDLFFSTSLGSDLIKDGIFVGTVSKIDPNDKKTFFLDTDVMNDDILYILL